MDVSRIRNSLPQYYASNLFNNFQPKKKQPDRSIFTANGVRDKLFKQKLRNIIYDDNFQHQRALSASSLRYLNDFSGRAHENEQQSSMVSPLSVPRTPLSLNQLSPMTPLNSGMTPRPMSLHVQRNQIKRPFRIKSGNVIRTIPKVVDPGFRQLTVTPVTSIYTALQTRPIRIVKYPIIFGTRLELQEPQPGAIRNYNKEDTRFVTPKRQYLNFIDTQPTYLNDVNTVKPKRVQFVTSSVDDSPELYAIATARLNSELSSNAEVFSPSDDIKPVYEIVEEDEVQNDAFQFRVNGIVQSHKINEKKK